MRLLDLRRKPEERRLVGGPADQMNADWEAFDDPERHHRRRLAGDVHDRRERRELAAAAELLPWVLGLEDPPDRHRQLSEPGREYDVDVVPDRDDAARESQQRGHAAGEDDARGLV